MVWGEGLQSSWFPVALSAMETQCRSQSQSAKASSLALPSTANGERVWANDNSVRLMVKAYLGRGRAFSAVRKLAFKGA